MFYIIIQTIYNEGWKALPVWEIPDNFQSKTSISILIPARNEAENIGDCIQSILNQNYPNTLLK